MTLGIKTVSGFLLRILAGGFILFMLVIVTIANRGEGGRWWAFIHSIPCGDKLGHVGLMGALCLLCNLAFTPRRFLFLPPSSPASHSSSSHSSPSKNSHRLSSPPALAIPSTGSLI